MKIYGHKIWFLTTPRDEGLKIDAIFYDESLLQNIVLKEDQEIVTGFLEKENDKKITYHKNDEKIYVIDGNTPKHFMRFSVEAAVLFKF